MNKKHVLVLAVVIILIISISIFTNLFKGDSSSQGARALDGASTLQIVDDAAIQPTTSDTIKTPTESTTVTPTPIKVEQSPTIQSQPSFTETELTKDVKAEVKPVKEVPPTLTDSRELTVSKIVKYGMKKDSDVVTVQQRLQEYGYLKGSVDGSYGKGTVAAVEAFQQSRGIAIDGMSVEIATLSALRIKLVKSNNTLSTVSSLTITSPNGSEVYTGGQQVTVKWTSTNIPSSNQQIAINLIIANANNVTLGTMGITTSPLANDGQETITLPTIASINQAAPYFTTAVAGQHYKLIIQTYDANNQYVYDYSDSFFSINQPNFTVTSPNGNEVYTEGQSVDVTWNTGNVPSNKQVSINLQIFDASNVSLGTLGVTTVTNDGQETITLPTLSHIKQVSSLFANAVLGKRFKILLGTYDANNQFVYDYSDDQFTINPTPTVFKVLTPNGNETYTEGQQIPVTWNPGIIPSNKQVSINIQIFNANNVSLGTMGNTTSINDGQETITLPTIASINQAAPYFTTAVAGQHYKIIIGTYDVNNQFVYDFSDDYFTINGSQSTQSCEDVSMGSLTYSNIVANGQVTDVIYSVPMTVTENCATKYVGKNIQFDYSLTPAWNTPITKNAFTYFYEESTNQLPYITASLTDTGVITSSDAPVDNMAYRIDTNTTKHFTLTITLHTPWFYHRNYRVVLNKFKVFSNNTLTAGETTIPLTPSSSFRTAFQYIDG